LEREYNLDLGHFTQKTVDFMGSYWSIICIIGNCQLVFKRCRWRTGMNTGLKWGKLKQKENLGDMGLDGRIILKLILK
jgi:hypothetical protein